MEISPQQLKFVFDLIKKESGISFTDDKAYLFELKMVPIVKKYNLLSISDLIDKIEKLKDQALINEIVEAMTINESSFFRDGKPFERLNDIIIPRLIANNPEKKKIKIWCAACSSGQEPYTIAMLLKEKWGNSGLSFEIKASDISSVILAKAKEGIYNQFEIQRGLPINFLIKYFDKIKEDAWQIKADIRNMINFEKVNLIGNISHFSKYDIIFCRNVLIYFDSATKVRVLTNLSNLLDSNGVLFLGASEAIFGAETVLKKLDENNQGLFIANR